MDNTATAPSRRLRTAARLVWPALTAVVVLWVLARIFVPPPPGRAELDPIPWHLAMTAYGIVGAIIVTRRPDNLVGWLFLVVGVFDPLAGAFRSVGIADLGPAEIPGAAVAAWVQAWIWAPSLGALALLIWVFPTGRPLPGLWRKGMGLTVACTGVLLLVAPVLLWPLRGPALLFDESLPGPAGIVTYGTFFVLMWSAAWAVVSLIVRFRRSRGEERQQLKWFAFAAAVVILQAFVDILVLDRFVGNSMGREIASALALLVIPVSAAFALLRYRLYDIDRLINRTVVYGALTAGLGAAYLAVVATARFLTAPVTGDSTIAVAASTLVVAALFRPARRRIQEAVDRRFNRAQYDAAQTVHGFSGRLRDEVELKTLAAELLGVVAAAMQPVRTALWLHDSEAPATTAVSAVPAES